MKKIPTLFERDWNGDRSRVVNQVHPSCEWVLAGEGTATRKVDGTCCMVRAGTLYKRREFRNTDVIPLDFEEVEFDIETGKHFGWMPVGDGPEDRYHREAFFGTEHDGTYELIGPKIQGNPEGCLAHHLLIFHSGGLEFDQDLPPRDFDGMREWLSGKDIEGIVWHHPDGRMAKIKQRDFGLKRQSQRR